MEKRIEGRVWKFGDNVDTDVIYPGRYLPILEAAEMALHALEGVDPEFPKKLKPGDILVAGSNFGCGSSREQAATCLRAAGVACVVAQSFSRLFFRNAVNQGLPLVQCAGAADAVKNGESIVVDFEKGVVVIRGKFMAFPPLPGFIVSILESGGLIASVRKRLAGGRA
jgi:3-isopropylmalate/(R)-2-methylmalate dehydratase small subunit